MASPMAAASNLRPQNQKHKKTLVAGLMITSLVDAFSILVIFLLASFSKSGEVLSLSKNMELPVSFHSEDLQRATLIKVEAGKIYVEDHEVDTQGLLKSLIAIRKELSKLHSDLEAFEPALTIQADRRIPYSELSPIILAGAQSGFSEVKFAVLAQ